MAWLEHKGPVGGVHKRSGDLDSSRHTRGLHARRHVYRVAPDVIGKLVLADDPRSDGPTADAHPQRQLQAPLGVELVEDVEEVSRKVHKLGGMVGPGCGHSARHHVGIPDGLDLLEPARSDGFVEGHEHTVEHLDGLRCRLLRRQSREAHEIAKQHRRFWNFVGDDARLGLESFCHRRRQNVEQQRLRLGKGTLQRLVRALELAVADPGDGSHKQHDSEDGDGTEPGQHALGHIHPKNGRVGAVTPFQKDHHARRQHGAQHRPDLVASIDGDDTEEGNDQCPQVHAGRHGKKQQTQRCGVHEGSHHEGHPERANRNGLPQAEKRHGCIDAPKRERLQPDHPKRQHKKGAPVCHRDDRARDRDGMNHLALVLLTGPPDDKVIVGDASRLPLVHHRSSGVPKTPATSPDHAHHRSFSQKARVVGNRRHGPLGPSAYVGFRTQYTTNCVHHAIITCPACDSQQSKAGPRCVDGPDIPQTLRPANHHPRTRTAPRTPQPWGCWRASRRHASPVYVQSSSASVLEPKLGEPDHVITYFEPRATYQRSPPGSA